ncbi:GNAT family N-acetyltransferase [Falsibacillus pallidus]|uniref:Acetyltransferase (GNAT) family protein n=1 Tax=Falsibacillus pallidus TaxID=493781 RepID=A0A370GUQ0_9BACI|nr:GNAT family N-acetyltransferase [Falsibacillus pallidus]RDI45663.1 acetyltransferase (GNAT) family protein [Falsibacillus pallidus]
MTFNLIPDCWTTKNLTIQDLKESEIENVQDLYEQGNYIHEWDGLPLDKIYVSRCFYEGDLPPSGQKEKFKIQVIRFKENENIVGMLNCIHGHPIPDAFYICYFYINSDFQTKGMGKEVIQELLELVQRNGFSEIRANVALKNWPAIRFWMKMGMTNVNGIYGDKVHGPDNFADIELSRTLK